MDSNTNLCIERSENELALAKAIQYLSENEKTKTEIFNIPKETTFYSGAIAHAYYAIFYSAKAYIISKGIKLPEQGQHQAVYYKFKKFVNEGQINEELLALYNEIKIKAEMLLEILDKEEENRTVYTYYKLPQANKEPAQKSIDNAQFFVSHIKALIGQVSKQEAAS